MKKKDWKQEIIDLLWSKYSCMHATKREIVEALNLAEEHFEKETVDASLYMEESMDNTYLKAKIRNLKDEISRLKAENKELEKHKEKFRKAAWHNLDAALEMRDKMINEMTETADRAGAFRPDALVITLKAFREILDEYCEYDVDVPEKKEGD